MVTPMWAVKAYPYPREVKQADGSIVTVVMRGDEHGHLLMTTDGHPVLYNEATANYEYATVSGGTITLSGIVAADASRRTAKAAAFLATQDVEGINQAAMGKRAQRAKARQLSAPRRMRINDFPTTGEQHSLVILVAFSDMDFTSVGDNAYDYYNGLLNQEGFTHSNGANGSARDFYVANSNGLFKPTFDVVGPVKVSKTCAYYGANKGNDDQYDRIGEMIKEACTIASSQVDYAKYDTNGDGVVDNIFFFYAGYGEADSYKANTIWPHSAKYEELDGDTLVINGMRISSYACSNEIRGGTTVPNGIGTFVHEFGHVLGLGDHYDIFYSTTTFTPGDYDTMDSGSYNNNGNTPPLFSAFERGELGWLDYTELTAETDTLSVLPELGGSNKAYRISAPDTNGREFYVLENRQKAGWDAYLPGHGMLMWHIDIDTTAWINNTINTQASHQRVDIVEADNRRTSTTVAGDPFPGTSNVTRYTMTSWAGDNLVSLDDIEEKDETIFLLLAGLGISIETPNLTATDVEDSSFVLSWNKVDIAKTYKLNVYEVGDDGAKVLDAYKDKVYSDADSIVIGGLKPDTRYEATMVASRGSYVSDTATVSLTTKELVFAKRQADSVAVTDITADGFTASWGAIDGADSYVVTLLKHSYDSVATLRGYDFAARAAGLPELWVADGSYYSVNGYYGEATPSLRFSARGGSLLVAYPHARISSLSFWGRGGTSADGYVYVERFADGQWLEVDSFMPNGDEGAAQVRNYSFEQSDTARIRMVANSGNFYIDDVVAGCNDRTGTPVAEYDGKDVASTLSFRFSGLQPATSYGFIVRGKQGDVLSYGSDELTAVTLSSDGVADIVAPMSAVEAVYDLQGRKTTMAKPGVYIIRKAGKCLKVVRK